MLQRNTLYILYSILVWGSVGITHAGLVNGDFSDPTVTYGGNITYEQIGIGWIAKGDNSTSTPDWEIRDNQLHQVTKNGSKTRVGQVFDASDMKGDGWSFEFTFTGATLGTGGSALVIYGGVDSGTNAPDQRVLSLGADSAPVEASGEWTLLVDLGETEAGSFSLEIAQDLSQYDLIAIRFMSRSTEGDPILSISDLRFVGPPTGIAAEPNPADEATDVPRDASLSWMPSEFAAPINGHKVYFGESFDDVNDATGGIAQTAASYTPAQPLDFGKTYYWRVDEIDNANTVYPGEVWSFTTEPFAYPIENIIAAASSSDSATTGPENTINGAGLDANDLHSTEKTDMWLSSSEPAGQASIQYEFDKVYKVHEMWVWNSNTEFESALGFGVKDVTIEHSTNGTDWTALDDVPEFAQAPGSADYAHNAPVDFDGAPAKYVKITANSNWGSLTQYGLSEVRFFYIPVRAREPNPDSGATGVDVDSVTLSWRAGREAAEHNVYLGTDEQAVANGTAPVNTVTEASYGPLDLDLGETYYWRVDEVNDAETPKSVEGDLWNFTTEEFLVIDDFEDYDVGNNEIWWAWKDGAGYGMPDTPPYSAGNGTGSAVGDETTGSYTEETIVHGGGQSMPYFYNNTGLGGKELYSEAEMTLSPPQDWTKAGLKALTLWFYGDWTNSVEQMYVKLNGVKVIYDGDMSDMQEPSWHEWNIELSSLVGVNLQNVNSITIGFGDGATAGGSGVVYFDDIRLYPARCLPSLLKPQADLNDDCVVDYQDLEILSSDWLLTDDVIPTTVPSETNKELHLQFDGNLLDSAPNGRNGNDLPPDSVVYVTGKTGQAIYLDGTNYVNIGGYKGVLGANAFSVTAWIRTSDNEGEIVGWGNPTPNGQRVEFRINANRLRCEHGNGNVQGDTNVTDNEWHHVALTVIENATISHPDVILYLDGEDDTRQTTDTSPFELTENFDVQIGQRYNEDDTRWFTGLIDDVRIYSRVLSGAEVAYLADETAGDGQLHVPVPSAAELYSGEPEGSKAIDLKDFAVLADSWLDELLWP